MVRTWIYNLKREELLQYGSEFKIELTGTVDAMRKEFGEWVEDNEGHAPHAERIDALARKHGRNSPFRIPGIHIENPDVNKTATSLAKMDFASTSEEARRLEDQKREERRAPWGTSSTFPQNQTNTDHRTNLERNPVRDYAAVAKQVREWSFKFDGNSKPLEFLEQVEWSAETYGLELDLVPRAMPELLKGTALKWYIANNEHWRTWTAFATSFQEFFLPRDYFTKLLEEVTRRKQGVDEPFKRYVVEMQTLMRPLRFSKERERQQIYSCSLPDFRAFARPYQNGSLIELMQLAEELQSTGEQRSMHSMRRKRQGTAAANAKGILRISNTRAQSYTGVQEMWTRRPLGERMQQRELAILLDVWANRSSHGPMLPIGKRPSASTSQERADADRSSSTKLVGALRDEGHRLSATVQIGNSSYAATIDTGATSSFVSEELAVTLVEEGFELGATQRQVRLADGRSSGVTEQVEVQIGLGNRQVDLALLVLPGVIDELVLGWDFLSTMGTILECAGIQVRIPARRRRNKDQEERLSVVNTLEQLTQEPGSREHESRQQENQERGTQEQATTGEQNTAEEGKNTDNGETSREPLHSDAAIDQFLRQEIAAFASMTGTSPVTEHRIVMHDDRPIKQRYFPKNPKMQEEINKQVDELLAKGCIEPSNSPHSAPIVMVKKKTGKWRLCVDFRQLNNRSVKDAYPLPRVHHILDQLREAHYITSLDLKDGYWQIPMEEASRPLTAFTVPGRGLFQWKVMPFGLHSAPATFQRALDRVIGPEMLPHAFAYLDDIIVIGKTLEEHKNNVKEVFRRLRAANLRINVDKCDFFKKELKYLGHKVTEHGICTDPEKVAAISQLKPPTNVKELRQYLGVASWYRRFVPDFANTVHPLGGLLKKGVKWVWSEEHQQAFEKHSSSSSRREIRARRPARRLPFHPHRRSSRKLPRLELDAAMTDDVLELSTSPILDPAVEAGLTPPPTGSPGSAGTVFRWPEEQQQEQQPEVQQHQQQEQQPEVQQQQPKQQKQRPKRQKPTLSLPTQPTTLPTGTAASTAAAGSSAATGSASSTANCAASIADGAAASSTSGPTQGAASSGTVAHTAVDADHHRGHGLGRGAGGAVTL
ncbi:hypothetical protein ACLKA6_010124 [Drosophila palustris]